MSVKGYLIRAINFPSWVKGLTENDAVVLFSVSVRHALVFVSKEQAFEFIKGYDLKDVLVSLSEISVDFIDIEEVKEDKEQIMKNLTLAQIKVVLRLIDNEPISVIEKVQLNTAKKKLLQNKNYLESRKNKEL